MLDIINNLNDSDLPENSVPVSFNVVNMFPSTDNESGIKAVKKVLNDRVKKSSYWMYITGFTIMCWMQ